MQFRSSPYIRYVETYIEIMLLYRNREIPLRILCCMRTADNWLYLLSS